MPVSPRDLLEHLMASSEEFQQLAQEHSQYEEQLEQLTKQPYLSAEDLTRQLTLKKLKLRAKDRMAQLAAQHLQEAGGV